MQHSLFQDYSVWKTSCIFPLVEIDFKITRIVLKNFHKSLSIKKHMFFILVFWTFLYVCPYSIGLMLLSYYYVLKAWYFPSFKHNVMWIRSKVTLTRGSYYPFVKKVKVHCSLILVIEFFRNSSWAGNLGKFAKVC